MSSCYNDNDRKLKNGGQNEQTTAQTLGDCAIAERCLYMDLDLKSINPKVLHRLNKLKKTVRDPSAFIASCQKWAKWYGVPLWTKRDYEMFYFMNNSPSCHQNVTMKR